MVQVQKVKVTPKHEQPAIEKNPQPIKDDKLNADTIDLLAAVDDILGELTDTEAQEFVANFIQKGGQ